MEDTFDIHRVVIASYRRRSDSTNEVRNPMGFDHSGREDPTLLVASYGSRSLAKSDRTLEPQARVLWNPSRALLSVSRRSEAARHELPNV